jgi:hypothetical protein
MQKPPKKPVKPGLLPQETGAGAEKNRSDKRKQQAPEQDGTGNCGWNIAINHCQRKSWTQRSHLPCDANA